MPEPNADEQEIAPEAPEPLEGVEPQDDTLAEEEGAEDAGLVHDFGLPDEAEHYDEYGNVLGKFKDVKGLAKSYDHAQAELTRKQQEAARYRRAMEGAGWTFNDQGEPVPPAPAQAPASAPAVTPEPPPQAPAPPAVAPAAATTGTTPQGEDAYLADPHEVVEVRGDVSYNRMGVPVLTREQWEGIAEQEGIHGYEQARETYRAEVARREAAWNQRRDAILSRRSEARRAELIQQARDNYGLGDDVLGEVQGAIPRILETVDAKVRNTPQALEYAATFALADTLARRERDRSQAPPPAAPAPAAAPRVVHAERGSSAAPARAATPKADISRETRAILQAANLTEEDYARYNPQPGR